MNICERWADCIKRTLNRFLVAFIESSEFVLKVSFSRWSIISSAETSEISKVLVMKSGVGHNSFVCFAY